MFGHKLFMLKLLLFLCLPSSALSTAVGFEQSCLREAIQLKKAFPVTNLPSNRETKLIAARIALQKGQITITQFLNDEKQHMFQRFKRGTALVVINTVEGRFVSANTATVIRHCNGQHSNCGDFLVLTTDFNNRKGPNLSIHAFFGAAPSMPVQCDVIAHGSTDYEVITGGQLSGSSAFSVLTCGQQQYQYHQGRTPMLPNGTQPFTSEDYAEDTLSEQSYIMLFANPGVMSPTIAPHWAPDTELLYEALEFSLDQSVDASKAVLSYPSHKMYDGSPLINLLTGKLIGIVSFNYQPGVFEDPLKTKSAYVSIPIGAVRSVIDSIGTASL